MDDLIFSKQPAEEFNIEADFSEVIGTGESVSLSTCTITAVDNTGADKTSDVVEGKTLSSSSKGLVTKVKAGDPSLAPYKITFQLHTDQDQIWELDVTMGIFS